MQFFVKLEIILKTPGCLFDALTLADAKTRVKQKVIISMPGAAIQRRKLQIAVRVLIKVNLLLRLTLR